MTAAHLRLKSRRCRKRKFSVVNPDQLLVAQYGADMRMRDVPRAAGQFKPWNTSGMSGVAELPEKTLAPLPLGWLRFRHRD
jgi:hypothetical protein